MRRFLGRQDRPRWFAGLGLALFAVVCAVPPIRAATNLPIPRPQVWTDEDPADQAIARATAYLYSQQHDGTWELPSAPPGTLTALSTYALLASGRYQRIVYVKAHDWYSDPAGRVAQYLALEWKPVKRTRFTEGVVVEEYVPKVSWAAP